jgi:hypothetical protein
MKPVFLYMCVLLPAAGCMFYDDDCDYGGGAQIAPDYLRNPDTGQCEEFGWRGGGGRGSCDEGDFAFEADRAPSPDWGACQSSCTGLDEMTCLGTPSCRASYVGTCAQDASCLPGDGNLEFYECWAVAPENPVSTGECWNLGAYDCSRHDNCAAVHWPEGAGSGAESADAPGLVQGVGPFQMCAPETKGCYGDQDCGPGSSCNANEICLSPPGCGGTGSDGACPAVCYGYCEPDPFTVDHCYGEVACDAAPPVCPSGSLPGIYGACWSGECIPVDQCPEGSCGGDVICDLAPPFCPAGQTPGLAAGCYTGYCVPTDACEPPPPACHELAEVGCVGRSDCVPYYTGHDCVCTADECVCQEWQFDSCAAL